MIDFKGSQFEKEIILDQRGHLNRNLRFQA
jgi:hypothetical protein